MSLLSGVHMTVKEVPVGRARFHRWRGWQWHLHRDITFGTLPHITIYNNVGVQSRLSDIKQATTHKKLLGFITI